MEAARSGGGGKELLLPATRDLWNSLEDFKLQAVMMIIMRIMVITMIMMGLVFDNKTFFEKGENQQSPSVAAAQR